MNRFILCLASAAVGILPSDGIMADDRTDAAAEIFDVEYVAKKLFRGRDAARVTTVNYCLAKKSGVEGLQLLSRCPRTKFVVLFPKEMNLAADDLDILATLPKLEGINLRNLGSLGDAGLAKIASVPNLQRVYVNGGGYSATGLGHLGTLKSLTTLTLRESDVAPADVLRFSLRHPDIRIVVGYAGRRQTPAFDHTLQALLGRKPEQPVSTADRAVYEEQFTRLDSDSNQWLSLGEFVSGGGNPPRRVRQAFFHTFSQHGHGRLYTWNYAELRHEMKEAKNSFAMLDSNENGFVTDAEIAAILPTDQQDLAPHIFQRLHADAPTQLDLNQFMAGWIDATQSEAAKMDR